MIISKIFSANPLELFGLFFANLVLFVFQYTLRKFAVLQTMDHLQKPTNHESPAITLDLPIVFPSQKLHLFSATTASLKRARQLRKETAPNLVASGLVTQGKVVKQPT